MATYNAKTLTITNNGDNYIIDPLQGNDVAYRDITVNIDAEDWELANNVYSYVWTNSYLTQNSQVQVYFKANVRGGLTGDLRVQKTTGQITFSTGEEPTDDISLLVRIIDANTTGILPINADMVETDAVIGETDVQGALEDLDERIREVSNGFNGYYIGVCSSMTTLKTDLIALARACCPSAVGSTDPQTVVNFSFYPNFTDTTAGFYPVSNGERIGTMYIRTADMFSCIIMFGDGSITKIAYDGTWKVDKLASESVLGDPSSASTVTGSDAFSKINSLNNSIAYKHVVVPAAECNYIGTSVLFHRSGKVLVVTIRGIVSLPSADEYELCTIPTDVLPVNNADVYQCDAIVTSNNDGSSPRVIRFMVHDGKLTAYNYGTVITNTNAQPQLVFITP